MSDSRVLVQGEFYRHFKNKLYQIKCIAYNSETKEKMVVYQAMYGDFSVYVRPYDMFMSEVDHVKYPEVVQRYRFERVDSVSDDVVCNTAIDDITNHQVQSYDEYEDEDQNQTVDERLLMFLDASNYQDKLNVLTLLREKMDDRLINDIATAMDVTVPEGEIDRRYDSLRSCLLAHAKYECSRF